MNQKIDKEESQPPSGIIARLKKYFRNPFFIKTQSVSEVTDFLKDALDQNVIDKEAESIATKAIRLGDITAKEIMIPRVDMVTIQVDEDTNEIIEKIIDSGHSRYPVLGNERNERQVEKVNYSSQIFKKRNIFSLESNKRISVFNKFEHAKV